jgi:hypothetical protein
VLFFKTKGLGINTTTFAFTSYTIGEVLYAGYFTGTNTKYQTLTKDIDFTVTRNIIKLINPAIVPVDGQISVTLRYKHAPAYHMIDMKRESMESSQFTGKENLIHLPIAGTARRAHYIIDGNNLNGDKLLNNSYEVTEVIETPPPVDLGDQVRLVSKRMVNIIALINK